MIERRSFISACVAAAAAIRPQSSRLYYEKRIVRSRTHIEVVTVFNSVGGSKFIEVPKVMWEQ